MTGPAVAARWRVLTLALCGLAGVLGGLALLGWGTEAVWLAGGIGGAVPIVPLTALCLVAGAAAVAVSQAPAAGAASAGPLPPTAARVTGFVLAAAVLGGGLAVLVDYAFAGAVGLDTLLLRGQVAAVLPQSLGRPSAWTGLAFVVLAPAVALLFVDGRRVGAVTSVLLGAVLVVLATLLLAYAFDATTLLRLGQSKQIAATTVLGLFLLTLAVAAARPARAPLGVLRDRADGGLLLWLLPLALLVPVAEGIAEHALEAAGAGEPTAEVVSSIATCVLTAALVVWLAVTRRGAHGARVLQQELAEERERFAVVFDAAPAGLVVCAPDGRILEANAAFARFVGRRVHEVVGANLASLSAPEDVAVDEVLLARVLVGEIDSYRVDKRYRRPDGRRVWGDLHLSVVRDDDGTIRYAIATVADVDLRRRVEDDLSDMATRDPLTGLANRAAFDDVLTQYAERYGGTPAAIVFVDLDDFKDVNDRYGHAVGDALLCEVAARFEESMRAEDIVARIGGDEFVAIARLRTDADVMPLLARVRSAFVGHVRLEGELVEVAASVGGALVDERGPVDAMRRADEDMYATKELRKRTVPPPQVVVPGEAP